MIGGPSVAEPAADRESEGAETPEEGSKEKRRWPRMGLRRLRGVGGGVSGGWREGGSASADADRRSRALSVERCKGGRSGVSKEERWEWGGWTLTGDVDSEEGGVPSVASKETGSRSVGPLVASRLKEGRSEGKIYSK
jgi:hypothetical protein